MQHLLYEVPIPQPQLLDFSESSLLFFFNYEGRYQLGSLNNELLELLTFVYLGHDFFPIQQWVQAEGFQKPIRWSGPDGLKSSLCVSLEIQELPVFIGIKNSKIVYFSKDWPNSRFIQDFKTGEVQSLMHEFIRGIVMDFIDNVGLICGTDFESPKLDEKSYSDTISVLQSEILNYQSFCKQQQLVIEALREELQDKNKQIQSLTEIVKNALKEQYNIIQQSITYEKTFPKVQEIKPIVLVDDDFWKFQEEDDQSKSEDLVGKGLWIMNLDTELKSNLSLPALPKLKSPNAIIKPINKSNLEEHKEKFLKNMQQKQPIGRDGKRIPLPSISTKSNKLAKSMSKLQVSGDVRYSKYTGN